MLNRFFMVLVLVTAFASAQTVSEVPPPYNIKTICFKQNGQVVPPIFGLRDTFWLEFDDLFGNEANYYFEIVHCDYDWTPSQLAQAEYMQGFDNQRIQDYTNSYNTLQLYSHYRLQFPNRFMQFRVSGNYLVRVLNEDREIMFSRKFILVEDLIAVPLQVRRARDLKAIAEKQNLDFTVRPNTLQLQNPIKNIKVFLMQNGRFDNAIRNVKPQYTIGTDLIYKYDAETQFWGGNEFRFFENKDIRAANNNVARVDSKGGTYNGHLFTDAARGSAPYTFAPDINGGFNVRNINAENNEIEADYAWIYFSLSAPLVPSGRDVYINGMFNNYAIRDEYKMDYNPQKGIYEKALMLKQGFVNYQYVLADKNKKIDYANAVDGNYFETENIYSVLVYYRENNGRYDRVIGRGQASSVDITN
jgi:hypothetical protein